MSNPIFKHTCKHCDEPIRPGGYWTGTKWSGWEHVNHYTLTCVIDGKLAGTKAEPIIRRYTVAGYDERLGEWTQPVEVRCPTCGQSLTSDDVAYLDELITWTEQHTCPTWSVT